MISRRKFLFTAGGVAGAAAAGGGAWAALVSDGVDDATASSPTSTTTVAPGTTVPPVATLAPDAAPAGDRVLVILELDGGNDGLNTLVPADGRYRSARPTLAVPEGELLTLPGTDAYGLNPALAPLVPHWESGTMAAVQGIGMLEQSRSHFTAMDTWWSATPGATSTTGWLGRWLDATLEGDPNPLRAIALGGGSAALVGERTVATFVRSPEQFTLRTAPGVSSEELVAAFVATSEPLAADPTLAAVQHAIPSTVEAIDLLAQVTGADPEGGGLSDNRGRPASAGAVSLLTTAAGIIDLGIGTRVITVAVKGFDTHADQSGRHPALLTDVAEGIAAFISKITDDGHAERVMLMTTSEFGRRVAENASDGTDHGNAGVQLLIGPSVNGGQVVGELDLANLVDGDVPTMVDTRSLYSVALDWLGGPTDELLDGPHDRLGLVA
ncbi:MAG: DUF1501 domain-containing protein [Acidimicrobiales bacterium]